MNDDSLIGRKNIYTCQKCGGHIVTIDRDKGVTPMFLACRAKQGCDGMMGSAMYPPFVHEVATWEWYSPREKQRKRLDPAMLGHVKQGGLMIRKMDGGEFPRCWGWQGVAIADMEQVRRENENGWQVATYRCGEGHEIVVRTDDEYIEGIDLQPGGWIMVVHALLDYIGDPEIEYEFRRLFGDRYKGGHDTPESIKAREAARHEAARSVEQAAAEAAAADQL